MSKHLDELELRSEEVQEVLDAMPHWMIRRGNFLFTSLIFLIIILSWVIKYPDVIQTETVGTTQVPPQKEFARVSSKLDSIYVEESQFVNKNTILAVLENPANSSDVYYLKSILDTLEFKGRTIKFPINEIPILILGDVETAYAKFENSYTEFELNKSLNPYLNEAIANRVSLNELKSRLRNMQSQYTLRSSELQLKKNDLKRNEELLTKGVISQLDYESKQLEFLSVERNLKSLAGSISQVREAIANADKNIKGTEITRTTEEAKLIRNTIQSLNQLKKAIRDWEDLYVFKSKIAGRVSFLSYWSKNQTVNQGDLELPVEVFQGFCEFEQFCEILFNTFVLLS